MSLETGTFIQDLVQTNPPGTDKKKQGDDHLRLIKSVLKNTFPDSTKTFYFPGGSTKTANYTIVAADQNKIIVGDATAGAITFTLPTLLVGDAGWLIGVVKSDASANAVIVAGTINGAVNYNFNLRYRHLIFQWSGSQWFAFSSFSAQAQVTGSEIVDLAISTAKLIDLSVTTAKIADISVTSGKLADNSISTAKIVDAAVTNVKLLGVRMTMQVLASGTAATYTTPTNCKSILVWAIGAGGGGAATTTNAGAIGSATTFNGVNANPGQGGSVSGVASVGGDGGVSGSGSATLRLKGAPGQNGQNGADFNVPGSNGAPGIFGSGGGVGSAGAGGSAPNNSGAGGAGGAGTNTAAGGGAGEQFLLLIQFPAASYVYTVGPGGNGGAAGVNAGGNGGSGLIIVFEFY